MFKAIQDFFFRMKVRRKVKFSSKTAKIDIDHELSDSLEALFGLPMEKYNFSHYDSSITFDNGAVVKLKGNIYSADELECGRTAAWGSISHEEASYSWENKNIRPSTLLLMHNASREEVQKYECEKKEKAKISQTEGLAAVMTSIVSALPNPPKVPTGVEALLIPEGHSLKSFPVGDTGLQLDLILPEEEMPLSWEDIDKINPFLDATFEKWKEPDSFKERKILTTEIVKMILYKANPR